MVLPGMGDGVGDLAALSLSPCVVIQQMIIAPQSFWSFLTVPKKLRISFSLQHMPPFSW